MTDFLRVYDPSEAGADGYPQAWHRLTDEQLSDWCSGIGESHYPPGARMGVKDVIRAEAGHRCVRCAHPYGGPPGYGARGEWTPCDDRCDHVGPARIRNPFGGAPDQDWLERAFNPEPEAVGGVAHGVRSGYEVEARWRVLTVHHLRTGAEAKLDLRWWNLAALCQRCHLTIQGKVVMDRIYPWPHTPWFRPYAAGFYAWRYLGENLTRTETLARLDELLALEAAPTPETR